MRPSKTTAEVLAFIKASEAVELKPAADFIRECVIREATDGSPIIGADGLELYAAIQDSGFEISQYPLWVAEHRRLLANEAELKKMPTMAKLEAESEATSKRAKDLIIELTKARRAHADAGHKLLYRTGCEGAVKQIKQANPFLYGEVK